MSSDSSPHKEASFEVSALRMTKVPALILGAYHTVLTLQIKHTCNLKFRLSVNCLLLEKGQTKLMPICAAHFVRVYPRSLTAIKDGRNVRLVRCCKIAAKSESSALGKRLAAGTGHIKLPDIPP